MHETQHLGLFLDYNLTCKQHSGIVGTKISRGLGVIRHFQNFLSPQMLLLLYDTLVHPYISYGCVLCNFYSNFKPVQILKNKVIRLIG